MGPATSKLLELASLPFLPSGATFELDDLDPLGRNGMAIKEILIKTNGFFCFEQALRFFSAANAEASWGVHEWNTNALWKEEYRGLADGVFCFAEDIFGNQFCISDEKVCFFNLETAEIEMLSPTIEELSEKILLEFNFMTGYKFAHEWQEVHGRLPVRQRLMPKKPFVLGGAYELPNLIAMDSIRVMKTFGNLARQIHDLPDGSQVQFKIL